jgi:hypothetical protein
MTSRALGSSAAALAVAVTVAFGGCFDFGRLGDADLAASDGGGSADLQGGCAAGSCGDGLNCIEGACEPAPLDCAALAAAHPALGDGVYWIASGTLHRAYCDMMAKVALCEQGAPAKHVGRTREGAGIAIELTSTLDSAGTCEVWAVRGTDGHPFAVLQHVMGVTMSTCEAWGFRGDVAIGSCYYGSTVGNCGFTNDSWLIYGNKCLGCMMNAGEFGTYVVMGPVNNGHIATSGDRTAVTKCRTD